MFNFYKNKIFKIDKNGKKHRIFGIIPGLWISFKGTGSVVEIQEPFPRFVRSKIKLKNNSYVYIGHSGRSSKLQISGESNQKFIIGKHFDTLGCELVASSENNLSIEIGDNCMFAKNIMLRASDGHSIIDNDTKQILNYGKSIIIGNNVWIAANVAILKGVKINDNCVIGHGSIVTHDCDNNSVYAGVPAKLIKSNIFWSGEAPH